MGGHFSLLVPHFPIIALFSVFIWSFLFLSLSLSSIVFGPLLLSHRISLLSCVSLSCEIERSSVGARCSARFWLCDLGQVTSPLRASVYISVKMCNDIALPHREISMRQLEQCVTRKPYV